MNGIKAYWRETFKRGWNYRGLWRESLDERPSAAPVYRWLLIAFTCLYVLSICIISYRYEYVNGIRQPDRSFIFPSMGAWIIITFFFIAPFIVYRVLWYWGKRKNNRHIISVLMYLMVLLIGVLVAWIVGALYRIFKFRELERFIYEAYGWEAYYYLIIPPLLVSPILVMWIQGWRQVLIFSPIIFLPYYLIIRLAAGLGL